MCCRGEVGARLKVGRRHGDEAAEGVQRVLEQSRGEHVAPLGEQLRQEQGAEAAQPGGGGRVVEQRQQLLPHAQLHQLHLIYQNICGKVSGGKSK
jgi:hypothetical protein